MLGFKYIAIISFFSINSICTAQENIVPNASFEEYVDVPDSWYNNGDHFTEIVRFWSSPTPASPDAYGPSIKVPKGWRDKGFGDIRPLFGNQFVGITTFGCEHGKPHCREYLQIRLNETMVVDQQYEVSIHVSALKNAVQSNNLGIYFSAYEITHELDQMLAVIPQFNSPQLIKTNHGEWKQLRAVFTPSTAYNFITIGNFYTDKQTESSTTQTLAFAYVYIDNVIIKKIDPILPVTLKKSVLDTPLTIGTNVILDNIYFDHDHAEFLVRSYEQLNKLAAILVKNPHLKVQVTGHTDNAGNDNYNMKLSEYRAKAVVDFLINTGIDKHRLTYIGYGSSKPLESNDTIEGRRINRRVEFEVIQI